MPNYMNMNNKKFDIILVGSGNMAREYLEVLKKINKKVIVVGRREKNISALRNIFPQFDYYHGGVEKFFSIGLPTPKFAINCVDVKNLFKTSKVLIENGIKNILLEKPGSIRSLELKKLKKISKSNNCDVFVAYNRRFFSSILKLKKEVLKDGGIKSLNFEFTEWSHTFDDTTHPKSILQKWIIANSSHVIDCAFFLIGNPKKMKIGIFGTNKIAWHRSGSIFFGFGKSENNIPFSYHANWQAPGRWSIEVSTKLRRFYLKPMEELFVQKLGSVSIKQVKFQNNFDLAFKPGLYLQTKSFLESNTDNLKTLNQQINSLELYNKIGGYK